MTDEQLALLLRQIAARIDNLAEEIEPMATIDAVKEVHSFATSLKADAFKLSGEYKIARQIKAAMGNR